MVNKRQWVFTQTVWGYDPHETEGKHTQDFEIDLNKILIKIYALDGKKVTTTSGRTEEEELCVYYNLPGKTQSGPPDINIVVKNGRLLKYGLGPCKNSFGGGCDCEAMCVAEDHGARWLALRGIASVIEQQGLAEPFLRYLDSL